ncbi:MAG: electron transfer flavoprotein subunit beta/FixA family protein [Oscillospiraceae bacterium]|nr:electron transfer flavoprotein subunit beta/FixA family protein [Oscillospiraceae bacterium]
MNIIVCVKQVPGAASAEMDPETGVLKRDGVEAKLNPYDLFAVEAAIALSEAVADGAGGGEGSGGKGVGESSNVNSDAGGSTRGGGVTSISMGPPQAREALLETVYMGVDQAVLLSDARFAGSDVLATAYTLSRAISFIGFDVIICGRQTTDGDTAQVGPELAEFLGIPHTTGVLSIRPDAGGLIVTVGQDDSIITQRIVPPCLLCADGGINTPRLPSYKRKRAIAADPVRIMTMLDISNGSFADGGAGAAGDNAGGGAGIHGGDNRDEGFYGLSGSPTQVERIYPPPAGASREVITGSGAVVAARLAAVIDENKFL